MLMTIKRTARTLALALISFAFISSTAHAETKGSSGKNVALIKKLVTLGKNQLAHRLKDPPSARFRDLSLTEQIDSKTPIRALCGIFNAKNSYGGYGEEELFYVTVTHDGTVDNVWTMDNSDPSQMRGEGDLSYIDRKLEYKNGQRRDFQDHCAPANGMYKEIWKQ